MRTGMEPFFGFCSAVSYAFRQIRIEYRAWQSYRRNQSPRTGKHGASEHFQPNKKEAIS
jgi:hypothetical protein